jgi:hypothetical protein
METTTKTYSEEDRNMGLLSKATRSDTMIVNQLTKREVMKNCDSNDNQSENPDKNKVKIAMTKTKFNSQKLEIYTIETKE